MPGTDDPAAPRDLAWLARAALPYLGAKPTQDGVWIRLERLDGTAISFRERDWPEIETLAREVAR